MVAMVVVVMTGPVWQEPVQVVIWLLVEKVEVKREEEVGEEREQWMREVVWWLMVVKG
jgi:hypothetical protein